MSLPHRLPRSEIGGQVPPRAARAEPPSDPFQDQPMVTEPIAPLTHIRRHHRFDSRPELVRNHTHSRHRPIVARQRLQIRETRPSRYSTKDRPEYKKLAKILKPGDVLVTWEASRAQRDLAAYVTLRDLCAERGVLLSYSGRTYD